MQVPRNPGQLILDEVAVRVRPMLTAVEFAKFCSDRRLHVTPHRLHLFEELRVFRPAVRVRRLKDDLVLLLDGQPTSEEEWRDYIVETAAPSCDYVVPDANSADSMPFYSIYQMLQLEEVLREMRYSVALEGFIPEGGNALQSQAEADWRVHRAKESIELLSQPSFRNAIPLLGQLISNRYQPSARTDQRTINTGATTHWGQWLEFSSRGWNWQEYRERFDIQRVAESFRIDEEQLSRAYTVVASTIYDVDPLRNWGNLIQFVKREKRDELTGDALRAQSYRELGEMIRLLHQDLFQGDLGAPEDQYGSRYTHVPEIEVRSDPRRHLEFVTNQFDLNPQPKVTLFVEGESEVAFIESAYPGLFGGHYGVSGIEIVNLRGVSNATGRKRTDRFNAIFRVADYLHNRQTIVYLLLDNEGQAKNLKTAARTKKSLFGHRQFAIPAARIKVWQKTFEWDNFSNTELAKALTQMAEGRVVFSIADLKDARANWRGGRLEKMYKGKTGQELVKAELAKILGEIVLDPLARKEPVNRPIVKFLLRVRRSGATNHLPTMLRTWETNQVVLDRGN